MLDLATVTHDKFEACLNQDFALEREDAPPLALRLAQVEVRGTFDPRIHKRQAFSLIFQGPIDPVMPQRIYSLHSAALGGLELFLVPIGPHQDGMRYEAVFT